MPDGHRKDEVLDEDVEDPDEGRAGGEVDPALRAWRRARLMHEREVAARRRRQRGVRVRLPRLRPPRTRREGPAA